MQRRRIYGLTKRVRTKIILQLTPFVPVVQYLVAVALSYDVEKTSHFESFHFYHPFLDLGSASSTRFYGSRLPMKRTYTSFSSSRRHFIVFSSSILRVPSLRTVPPEGLLQCGFKCNSSCAVDLLFNLPFCRSAILELKQLASLVQQLSLALYFFLLSHCLAIQYMTFE